LGHYEQQSKFNSTETNEMNKQQYRKRINALIPTAVERADAVVKRTGKMSESRTGVDGKPYAWCLWTEYFHAAMKDLTLEAGLRRC
jgi:hypothetical protein